MDMSNTPKPIVYALSLVIAVVGSAAGYRIFQGSGFEYDGILGNISLQTGDESITLQKFVDESAAALQLADNKIKQQQGLIGDLEKQLKRSEKDIKRLTALTKRVSSATNQAEKTRASQALLAATQRLQVNTVTIPTASISPAATQTIQKQLARYNSVNLKAKVTQLKK